MLRVTLGGEQSEPYAKMFCFLLGFLILWFVVCDESAVEL
jgi:hypothetical protein